MELGDIIKAVRLERKYSQAYLADMIGVDEAVVRRYENNKRIPKLSTRDKIASALDINPWVLRTNWNPSRMEAFMQLVAIFDKFKGEFSKDKSGNISLKFEGLAPLIRDWEYAYDMSNDLFEEAEQLPYEYYSYITKYPAFTEQDLSSELNMDLLGDTAQEDQSIPSSDLKQVSKEELDDEFSRLTFRAFIRELCQDPQRFRREKPTRGWRTERSSDT